MPEKLIKRLKFYKYKKIGLANHNTYSLIF